MECVWREISLAQKSTHFLAHAGGGVLRHFFRDNGRGGVSAARKGAQKGCPKGKVISKEDKEKKEEICIMHRRVMEKLSFFAKRR